MYQKNAKFVILCKIVIITTVLTILQKIKGE